MLAQAENNVRIEGILSEIDVREGSFQKNGVPTEYLGGNIKIRVNQEVYGEMKEMEIPVAMFATKMTRAGKQNPAYESIRKLRDDFVSIAAAGNEKDADRIRITNGTIQENAFIGRSNEVVSYPRITASFFTKVKREEFKPEASFTGVIAVGNIADNVDREGNPTGALDLTGIIVQYGGRADVVKYVVTNDAAVNHIRTYWNNGDTVKIKGLLNFSTKTVEVEEEMGFGDPIVSQRTQSTHDLIITGGSSSGFDSDTAYDENELAQALAERKTRMDALKEKPAEKPAASKTDFGNLGF